MERKIIFFSLGIIVCLCFTTISGAQQQTLDQLTPEEKLQLEQQQIRVEQGAQQQLLEEQQEEHPVVVEPDQYLFGGDYYYGRGVYNYSHRGIASRRAAHSGGSRGGRR